MRFLERRRATGSRVGDEDILDGFLKYTVNTKLSYDERMWVLDTKSDDV